MTKNKKSQPDKESREVVIVEPKQAEENKPAIPSRVDNIRIDRIGSLTLNLVSEPLKKRYEKHYKTDKTRLLIDLALVAIIFILLGVILNIWLFSKSKLINLIDFQVNTHELINGQEAEFTIDYTRPACVIVYPCTLSCYIQLECAINDNRTGFVTIKSSAVSLVARTQSLDVRHTCSESDYIEYGGFFGVLGSDYTVGIVVPGSFVVQSLKVVDRLVITI